MLLFNLGEVRQVGIQVLNQIGQDFTIETADYEIINSNGESLEKGYATIEEHKILTLFHSSEIGNFYCIFTYRIASEILKAKVYIRVN